MSKTRRVVFVALFAGLLGILSQLSVPTPSGIPLTLQVFAVALCGRVLGWASGSVSLLVWLTLGAVGIPLFSGFRGGIAVLLGPTGGFLTGFLPLALFCGIAPLKQRLSYYLFAPLGLILCHLSGVLWFCFETGQPFILAAATVSLPYLWKDFLFLIGADLCAKGILKILPFLRKN